MRKKLVMKTVVLDFDFDDEGGVPAVSARSRQEGTSKRARHISPVGEGGTSMAEVSPSAPMDDVPVPAIGRGSNGPSTPPSATTVGVLCHFLAIFPEETPSLLMPYRFCSFERRTSVGLRRQLSQQPTWGLRTLRLILVLSRFTTLLVPS